MRRFVALVIHAMVMGAFSGIVTAGDTSPIEFAVPEEGKITLGVFDSAGKLVRHLHNLAQDTSFQTGLNGLMTSWDGRNDAGQPMPPGRYHVRGYLVNGVEVAGEDFHFNEWVTNTEDPPIRQVRDFTIIGPGEVVLLADVAGGVSAVRYSVAKGVVWDSPLGNGTKSSGGIAAGEGRVFLIADRQLLALDANSGKKLDHVPKLQADALAADATSLWLATGDHLTPYHLADLSPGQGIKGPSRLAPITAGAGVLAGLDGGAILAQFGSGGFEKLDLPVRVRSLAAGDEGRLWIVADGDGAPVVGEIAQSGPIARTLRSQPGDGEAQIVRSFANGVSIGVLSGSAKGQLLRIVSKSEAGGWEIDWERRIETIGNFGMKDGILVPDGCEQPSSELEFRLEENPLTNVKSTLRLRAVFDSAGVHLQTEDALPVAEISTKTDVTRVVILRGNEPDSMRVLCGNGVVVEEYAVTGLKHVIPLDAGDVDLR